MFTNSNVDKSYNNNVIPVITLKSNIQFASGNGTIEKPFEIK